MADHYLKSVELLDEVEQHKRELRVLYADRMNANRSHLIAGKHDAIRQAFQAAKVHAQLAEVQQLREAVKQLRDVVQLAEQLTLLPARV